MYCGGERGPGEELYSPSHPSIVCARAACPNADLHSKSTNDVAEEDIVHWHLHHKILQWHHQILATAKRARGWYCHVLWRGEDQWIPAVIVLIFPGLPHPSMVCDRTASVTASSGLCIPWIWKSAGKGICTENNQPLSLCVSSTASVQISI